MKAIFGPENQFVNTGTSPVDIEALAERYENPDFWRRSLQEADDDGPRADHIQPKTSVKMGGFEAKDCAFAV